MPDDLQPQWQPISMLPTIAYAIDGMLESAEETLNQLRHARLGSLDNYTVGRVVEVYTVQRDDLWLYEEQLKLWHDDEITADQHAKVERLTTLLPRLRTAIEANLALADMLKHTTIEAIMSKSDVELGMEYLTRTGLYAEFAEESEEEP